MSIQLLPATLAGFIACIWATAQWVALSLSTLLLAVVARRLFFHPLSHIPGPKLAAVSNAWYAYHVKHGLTAEMGQKLHRQYGPAVRVGPNEVWFNTKEAFDTIYCTGLRGYEKSDFYIATALAKPHVNWRLQTTFEDGLDLLSETDMQRYRLQRRLIGRVYRTDNVIRHEGAIDKTLNQVVAKLKALKGSELDLKEWMHIIAVECLGSSVLSWSPGMLQECSDRGTSEQSYLGWRRKSVYGLFPMIAALDIKHRSIGRTFGNLWGITFPTPKGFKPFFIDVAKRVNRRIKAASRVQNPPKNDNDLLGDLIQLHKDKPEFTELYLKKMAITNFGAGHETLASTLTAVMSMLGTHPAIQDRARREIKAHAAVEGKSPSFTSASINLPYTRAVIREAMRLYPVITMGLPRRVPAAPLDLHGYLIPSGTTVGCNPAALHRNEDICGPRGDEFDPMRWLERDDDNDAPRNSRAATLERYSLNWGGGSRSCPGRYLAELIVLITVARLLPDFDIRTTVPQDASVPSYFLSMLTGVSVQFLPRPRLADSG